MSEALARPAANMAKDKKPGPTESPIYVPDTIPRVSIGLPVFNGEAFLEQALESLLGQTFRDFELIISDNGSTDRTARICREYAAKDNRIHYLRNEINLGAAENFNRVFRLARGEYFKWAAADDVCAPEFLERSVAALDQDQDAVWCCCFVMDIDENGKPLRTKTPMSQSFSVEAHERFRGLIQMKYGCEEIFGMGRTSVLRKTKLIGKFSDSDRVLLSHLGLLGRFCLIQEPLFLHRMHSKRSTRIYPDRHFRMVWFDPAAGGRFVFPYWRMFVEYLQVVERSALPWRTRIRSYVTMLAWLRDNRRRLSGDLRYFLKELVARCIPGSSAAWHRLK